MFRAFLLYKRIFFSYKKKIFFSSSGRSSSLLEDALLAQEEDFLCKRRRFAVHLAGASRCKPVFFRFRRRFETVRPSSGAVRCGAVQVRCGAPVCFRCGAPVRYADVRYLFEMFGPQAGGNGPRRFLKSFLEAVAPS